MKRPFAVIGFSMLAAFIIVSNISHSVAIALLIGAVAIFCGFIIIKPLRKNLIVIFALFGVIVFSISFISAEKYYLQEFEKANESQVISGIVCETPKSSDYAYTYVVKVADKNYKVRFVAEEDCLISNGDYVKINTSGYADVDDETLRNSLSSRVFFTIFQDDKCTIEKTGKTDFYYKNIGVIKEKFTEIVVSYLPGRNGAMALGLTIGDKSEIDDKTIDYFNYCGTSHLLVISGLHLSIWSLGIVNILGRFSRLRKYSSVIGIICLFLYASITGFSVSVIRAGTMVGIVLLGNLFKREADSINSIGIAVAFILMCNPFAPYSISFWLTMLSTIGLIVYSPKIQQWIYEKTENKFISKIPLYSIFVESAGISLSAMIFTMPVFVFDINMISKVSILTNFIMVDVALVMMVFTIAGVASHVLFLKPLAKMFFFIVGALGEYLHYFAEKIGLAEWSSLSLNHRYYKYFLLSLLIGVAVALILKKYKADVLKQVSIIFAVAFCLLTVYCSSYDYNTPSVEIEFTSAEPVITAYSKGESALVGLQDKKYIKTIKEMLNAHNEKQFDYIAVTENENKTIARLICLYDNFGKPTTYFQQEVPCLFSENSKSNVVDFMLADNVYIDVSDSNLIRISTENKSLIFVNCKKTENIYEKAKNYDIIILYNDKMGEVEQLLKNRLTNSQIIVSEEGKKATVYL